MTVNVALVAFPPGVVTVILLVTAPVGTVAVICLSEFTTKLAALLPKVTFEAWINPVPLITTFEPTGPVVGERPEIVGTTIYFLSLVRVPLPVVTVTGPEVPAGTIAVR
jgi:hypothetical protein